MPNPKVLVVGFGPFTGAPVNPSARLALQVAMSRRIASSSVTTVSSIIPSVYQEVFSRLSQTLRVEKPDVVLMFGLARSTPYVRIEMRAVNVASGVYSDAARQKLGHHSLIAGAPHILRVRAPAQHLLRAVRSVDVKARVSIDAGRYICNAAFFQCLDMARRKGGPTFVAFIHIPSPRGRGRRKFGRRDGRPTMARLKRASEAILLTLISTLRTSSI